MKKRAEQKSIKNFEKELKEKRAKELEVRVLTFSVHHGSASDRHASLFLILLLGNKILQIPK